jgi:peptidoglycan glycosyltransferase
VNRQIARLFTVIVVLFGLLVAFTSRWTVFEAGSLENQSIDGQQVNQRPLLEQQSIPRGLIRANDGTRLAVNKRSGTGKTKIYTREYPLGPLFSHAVGYSFIEAGSAGLERYYNDELSGQKEEFESLLDQMLGQRKEGQDLRSTLDPRGQRAALQGLGGRNGSVVALDPQTGKVLVMANVPSYDPNKVVDDVKQGRREGSGRFNRATQARYPPGSTFKVVTAAAALDSGRYRPDSLISGKNNKKISGVPLQNSHGVDFPTITLTKALTFSVNTVFAEVAEKLGSDTMYRYMRRFGFNQKPPIDLPADELTASGVYKGDKLLDGSDSVDIGRVGIGQERLLVTPLQMAMVAAAVANDGALMKPRLGDRFVNPDGRLAGRVREEKASQVMSSETARALTEMMGKVVEEGTGTQAALTGIDVAGKTGTAEVANATNNQAWFIAFAPKNDPRVAIAVTVERAGTGQGGTVAAPIAKRVFEALLGAKADG